MSAIQAESQRKNGRRSAVQRWLRRAVWLPWLRLCRWWRVQDSRYRWKWRAANVAAAVLMLTGAVLPIAQQLWQSNRYELSAEALQLVGQSDPTLTKQLTYDPQTSSYQFNQSAVTGYDPAAALKSQVGTASGQGSDKSLYALNVPTDMSKGVTYTDTNSQLSFSLVPQFGAMAGQAEQGHLVFPLAGGTQAVYTLKNNGLKEDIVVEKATQDNMTFSYKLQLPKTLAVKVIPNSGGAIGIYGPDPSLLGNISYGSSKDQQLVEKAREKADKTTLIFGLPSPVIKDTAGNTVGSARFVLQGETLQVVAENLGGIKGAFTIDPSVVITSASDFATGNDEGMINFNTSGQVTRDGLTGGSLSGGWQTATSLSSNVEWATMLAYNGYLYSLSGQNRYPSYTYRLTPYYAQINSDGSLGSWTPTSNLPALSQKLGSFVAYSGYIYGLASAAGSGSSAVYSALINSDGSLGSWTPQTSLPVTRDSAGIAAYNGYVYLVGGSPTSGGSCNGTGNCQATVYYAPLQPGGTVGTWNTTSTLNTARAINVATAYNGYLYTMGGVTLSGYTYTAEYARINSDGTLSSWINTTSIPSSPLGYGRTGFAYNGYMYLLGDLNAGSSSYNTVRYAQINANGSLGTWQTTTALPYAAGYGSSVAYNGYMYFSGGLDYSNTTDHADVVYAKIDPAGMNTPFTTTGATALPAGRNYASSVAYNGYLYVLGGNNAGSGFGSRYNSVAYAALSSTGTVGSWTTSGNTFVSGTTITSGTAVAYNGYLYYLGGYTGSSISTVQYAAINSNGSIGTWATTTAMPTAKRALIAWAYNGYLYEAMGYHDTNDTACNATASNYCSDVQYAAIASNGTVGSWTATNSLPNPSAGAMVAVNGSYAYVTGGDGTGGGGSSIRFALMNANGTLGSWGTTSSTTYRAYAMMGAYNGYLYAWGAETGGDETTGSYAMLMPDGTVATDSGCGARWCSMQGLVTTAAIRTGAIYNGYLYAYGGTNGTSAITTGEVSQINNGGNGDTGSWASTTNLSSVYTPGCVAYNESFAANGYLYTVGGQAASDCATAGGTAYTNVAYAPINSDGTIGSWTATSSLNTPRYQFGLAVYNGYVYAIGGNQGTGTFLSSVEYAPIHSDGTLGSWTTATGSLTAATYFQGAGAYNGYLYSFGGLTTGGTYLTTVEYAPINSDGSPGSWSNTTGLPSGRAFFGAVIYNGYAYVVGGANSTTVFSDALYAKLNSDGTISSGGWNYTSPLPVGRKGMEAVVQNGYLYAIVGYNTSGTVTKAAVAAINADGSLGQFSQSTNAISSSPNYTAAAVYDGYVYILGGYISPSYLGTVQYAPLSSIARVGHYSKLIDLGSAVNVTSVTYNGTLPGGTSAITYRAAGSNGVFGSSATTASISGTIGCLGTTTNTRYLFIMVTLDDSSGQGTDGSFPDSSGTDANLTDFTVNYNPVHPPPQIRLRTGQTLQEGNLSPLDTCYP